ncbi:hypothetical protein GP486_006489 [Trichoglossum hirsutum]|uniref:Uncharacterized protein n=1 Tax=Trichoglossum hirsutum TaxID=265104 RepID=A0A9P8IIL0_9PEZI|nr:hypothetical protein GP486_006489 [Trichoglossum hirsutum]
MAVGTAQLVLLNITTIENLTRKTKVWQLAVLIPRPEVIGSSPSDTPKVGFLQVTYGLPGQTSREKSQEIQSSRPLGTPENHNSTEEPSPPSRTFAVLRTQPGENPWDLGKLENFKSVMGDRLWDWFLPLRHSPSRKHDHGDSAFLLGAVVDRMRKEAGHRDDHHITGVTGIQRAMHGRLKAGGTGDTPTVLGIRAKGDDIDGKKRQSPES